MAGMTRSKKHTTGRRTLYCYFLLHCVIRQKRDKGLIKCLYVFMNVHLYMSDMPDEANSLGN